MEKLKTFVILAELDCIAVLLLILNQKGVVDQTTMTVVGAFALICTAIYFGRFVKTLQSMSQR